MQPLTQGEFFDWVQEREATGDRGHYELLGGEIIVTPPAGYPHSRLEVRLAVLVTRFVEKHALGVVLGSSQGYDLPTGDTVEPDLSFIGNARWKAGPRPEAGRFVGIVPDLVVEILSTKTRVRDRTTKRAVYERAGVREYWMVDPRRREIVQITHGEQVVCRERLVSGVLRRLVVDVRELFADC